MLSTIARRSITLAAAGALALAGLAGPAVAGDTGHATAKKHHSVVRYVAMGDSLAAGYQPDSNRDHKQGGYTGIVADSVARHAPKHAVVKLRNFACSGETSTTLVKGGRCTYGHGTQFAAARYYLKAHARQVELVTLTIGANDVTPCLKVAETEQLPCVGQRLTVLSKRLDRILGMVHHQAPDAKVVVTNYYNPFLAAWFTDKALAAKTTMLQSALNGVITGAADKVGAKTADLANAFRSADVTPSGQTGPTGEEMPTNVATICSLTWMCQLQDIHANDAGYRLIGRTVRTTYRSF